MSIHFPGGFSGPYMLIAQSVRPGPQAGQMNSSLNPHSSPNFMPMPILPSMPQPYIMMMAVPMQSFPIPPDNLLPRPTMAHPSKYPPMSEAAKLLFKTLIDKRPFKEVIKILDSGVPLNVRNENGSTLMHEAAFYERLDVIDELKRRGANVDVQNMGGLTPLHEAALRSRMNSVRKLCSLKTNVNAKDVTGKTPLHYSCMIDGNAEVIFQLLQAGAKINEPDKDGNTPMHIAAEHQLRGAITQLKQKGGNPHQKNYKNITPRKILHSVSNPAFERHVTIQLPEEPLHLSKNGLPSSELETPLPAANSLKSKKAAPLLEPQALTAFQFVDPLSKLRTSLEQKGHSIADLDAIEEKLDSGENPFLKNEVDWAAAEQRPLFIPATEDTVDQVIDHLELWLTQNPLIEPVDQNPASQEA